MFKQKFDYSSLLGAACGIFILAIVIFNEGKVNVFFNLPGFLIVFGGITASSLNAYSVAKVLRALKVSVIVFIKGNRFPYIKIIEDIIKSAEIIRRQGPLALEGVTYSNPFLEKGIQNIIDGTKTEIILEIFDIENSGILERHKENHEILENMSNFGPAWGMIGTLIGLVLMLIKLKDPSTIGNAMATALLTTFYGAVLANFIFTPLMLKLEKFSQEEMFFRKFVIEGLISVANGENPRLISKKLLGFLSDDQQKKFNGKLKVTKEKKIDQNQTQIQTKF